MNKGLRAATGDYVYFLNAGDTFIGEEILSRVDDIITLTGNLDLYYGNVLLVNNLGPAGFLSFKNVDLNFLYTNMVCHQSIFAKRALLREGFKINYRISGDYEWELRVFLNTSVRKHFLNFAVCNFEVGGISMNRRDLLMQEKGLIKRDYFSFSTRLMMAFLKKSRLGRLLKRDWISKMIKLTSYAKWKRIGLVGNSLEKTDRGKVLSHV